MSVSPQDSALAPALPWRTEGVFSAHYLTHRLPAVKSADWPAASESDAAFDALRLRLQTHRAGLQTGSEEDCEDQWITPTLHLLGFGCNTRKAIPHAGALLLPDYLLYPSEATAQAAFLGGSKDYYAHCLGLAEAKKWGLNLSREGAGGKGGKRSPHMQMRGYLDETPDARIAADAGRERRQPGLCQRLRLAETMQAFLREVRLNATVAMWV